MYSEIARANRNIANTLISLLLVKSWNIIFVKDNVSRIIGKIYPNAKISIDDTSLAVLP